MVLANALKAYRHRNGLTQAALGRTLGVTSQMVSLLEQGGGVAPSLRLFYRIVILLDLDAPTVKAVMLEIAARSRNGAPHA